MLNMPHCNHASPPTASTGYKQSGKETGQSTGNGQADVVCTHISLGG